LLFLLDKSLAFIGLNPGEFWYNKSMTKTKTMSLKDAERELVRMRKELRAFETKERAFSKRVEGMRHNARKAALVAAPGLAGWRAVRTATVKKGDIVRREDGTQHTVTGTSYSRPRHQYTIYFAGEPMHFDVGLTYKRREMHLVKR